MEKTSSLDEGLEYVKDLPGYERTKPQYFQDPMMDKVIEILFLLGGEIWTNRDRHAIMEHLLTEHGKVTTEMIEAFEPDEAMEERLKAERTRFIHRCFGVLYGDDMQALPDQMNTGWLAKD